MDRFIKLGSNFNSSETVLVKVPYHLIQQIKYIVENADENELNGNTPVKGSWTQEEDDLLVSLIEQYGPKRWSDLSEHVVGRNGKQCRERYLNHLDPKIKKGPFDEKEDALVTKLHQIYGNQWSKIAKHLVGRTPNGVKNRWNCSLRRQSRRRTKVDVDILKKDFVYDKNGESSSSNETPPQQPNVDSIISNKNDGVVLFQELFPENTPFSPPPHLEQPPQPHNLQLQQPKEFIPTLRNPTHLPCLNDNFHHHQHHQQQQRKRNSNEFVYPKLRMMEDEETVEDKMDENASPRSYIGFKEGDELVPMPPFQEISGNFNRYRF